MEAPVHFVVYDRQQPAGPPCELYLDRGEGDRVKVSAAKQSVEALTGRKVLALYNRLGAAAPYIEVFLAVDGHDWSITAFPLNPAGPYYIHADFAPPAPPAVSLDFRISVDNLNTTGRRFLRSSKEYFLGLVLMHKPDGKDVAEVSKDVSPTIKARHHRDGLTVTGSCSSLHAKLTPGSRGSLIFSMQLWEEDSKESAALHAKALYEPDEVVKTFKPTLTDHETSLASAIDQVGVGANAAGDIAVAIPVPQAMAAGAALKGISQAWSIGSKIYQSWRYPDFEGLYLTIFRYRCEADGVVEWYWEPDDQHIHEAPIPLPAAAAAPRS